jgi:DNA-binding winged helix-turn-helix (wHTH) protein
VRARFDDFVFDSSSRQLTRGGRPVPLSPKGFDLLALLLEQRPNVVTKATILDHVWADTPAAADGNLTVVIAEVRKALGDDPQAARYVRTVHRFGYAFCGDALDLDAAPPAHVPGGTAPETRVLLTWGDQVRRLTDGEHIVGRDPACGVWLDVSGVSRRHARLVVRGDQASLEDLDSTNGTTVDDVPVAGQQRLLDGQRIHFGPLEVRFRFYSGAVKTEKVRK